MNEYQWYELVFNQGTEPEESTPAACKSAENSIIQLIVLARNLKYICLKAFSIRRGQTTI